MTELMPGEVLAGYVIARRIGTGGSGVVYAARHPRLPRLTALKVLKRDETAAIDTVWRRFEREADIAAHFDHPNIVSIYDRGVTDERFWISMQYIEGADVSELHELSPDRALRIAADIAAALDYAHGKGVLHRDVKPSNILLAPPDSGRPERALLTDFGIARLRDETTQATSGGNISATFAFASPEQVSGKPVGPRSDQYSLACTLFVLLTDRRPFHADNLLGWVHAHTQEDPLRVSEVRPDLPAAMDAVLARAMAKDPEQRYPSCGEFVAAAIAAYYSDPAVAVTAAARIPVPPRESETDEAAGTQPSTPSWTDSRTAASPRPGRSPLWPKLFRKRVLVPVVLAAVVATGVGLAWSWREEPATAPAEGSVPTAFVGTWLASEGRTNYRLAVSQGRIGDAVLSNIVDGVLPNGSAFHCEFAAPLKQVPSDGDRVLIGTSEIVANNPPQACRAAGPTTLTLLPDGRVSRKTDVSGLVTYTSLEKLARSWGAEHSAVARTFPSVVGEAALTGRSTGWQGGTCVKGDPGPGDAAAAQGAHRILCNPQDDTGQVRFDIFDFGTRPAQSVADMFFGGRAASVARLHRDVAGELTITTAAEVDRDRQRDTEAAKVLVAVTFPDGDPRSRYILMLRWPGHTVRELLDDWLADVPLK